MPPTSAPTGLAAVLRFSGDLDASNSPTLRTAFEGLAPGHDCVVIDLSEVTFVDSSALGAIIGGIRRVRAMGGEPAICAARPSIVRILSVTGVDRLAPVESSVAAALRRFGADVEQAR